ncbi:hypothetical protein ACFFJY_01295 [Fictibacillus aquaticus]|uniref:Uncharacterized protein n=1 Tax=Fictibacillus aquaticus TaxID=2021314 RepID=A0A235F7Z3_9BACL|nr:hypothetical protein [Fictibacillus aquaticus]OYD57352.1 hypothetical protein CGZ90_11770 [Fictibacillus aquaticus]
MRYAASLVLAGAMMLSGCSEDQPTAKPLNDKHLELQSREKDSYPHYYGAVDIKQADKALPFKVILPKKYPFKGSAEKSVITDWGKKKKLSVETGILPSDQGLPFYMAMYTFNHENKVSQMIKDKQYSETAELDDGTEAYITVNDSYISIGWKDGEFEHLLEYAASSGALPKSAKKDALKAASSAMDDK